MIKSLILEGLLVKLSEKSKSLILSLFKGVVCEIKGFLTFG